MKDKIILGAHVSLKAPHYYVDTVKEAISYGATTFMFYTGAPQNAQRAPLSIMEIEEGKKILADSSIIADKIVVHAPYIINLGNPENPELVDRSIEFILKEMERTHAFGVKILVLHPGAHIKAGVEEGLKSVIRSLNEVFKRDKTGVIIALETMAGKGSELCSKLEEVRIIIDGLEDKTRIGVCIDTCHLNDAGYNVSDADKLLDEFDEKIGLKYLSCVHLNDSKNVLGAHKDRHENIGYGEIGFATIASYVHNKRIKDVPKILETPWVNGKAPYEVEIKMLVENTLIDNWKEKYFS